MRFAYPAVFLCAVACASAPSVSRSSVNGSELRPAPLPAATSTTTSTRGYLITGSFMTEYFSGETLADVLRRRAPLYLRPRATANATRENDPVAVYIDGSFSGSLEVLSSIPAYDVFSVERVSAAEAGIRFGPKHSGGALIVRRVRR